MVVARPRDLLEFLLPQLLTHPMRTVSARALQSIAAACSAQLQYHFHVSHPPLAIRHLPFAIRHSSLVTSENTEGRENLLLQPFAVYFHSIVVNN